MHLCMDVYRTFQCRSVVTEVLPLATTYNSLKNEVSACQTCIYCRVRRITLGEVIVHDMFIKSASWRQKALLL